MQPRADVAGVILFIADDADLAHPRSAGPGGGLKPVPDLEFFGQPKPDGEHHQGIAWEPFRLREKT